MVVETPALKVTGLVKLEPADAGQRQIHDDHIGRDLDEQAARSLAAVGFGDYSNIRGCCDPTVDGNTLTLSVFEDGVGTVHGQDGAGPLVVPVFFTAATQDSDGSEKITKVTLSLDGAPEGFRVWSGDDSATLNVLEQGGYGVDAPIKIYCHGALHGRDGQLRDRRADVLAGIGDQDIDPSLTAQANLQRLSAIQSQINEARARLVTQRSYMKPDAPQELRGPYQPIRTATPGFQG